MKICVIMLGLFGDVLLRTPILRALKTKFPDSKITVIVDKIGYEVLKNNPNIEKIITMDRNRSNYLKYIISKISTQFKIILNKFDLLIDLYDGSSSKMMAKFSFARWIIKNKTNSNLYSFQNRFHLTNQLFEKISEIKFHDIDISPEFFIDHKATKCDLDKNSYILSLGSGDLEKILSFEKNFKLVEYIYNKFNLIPAIVQNPKQEFLQNDFINNFLAPKGIKHIKLNAKSINEIAFYLKNTNFLISPDTGILHLAFAVKTPSFCVFTKTHPILITPPPIASLV
ncbi:glycosyltransferase family 9 protein [Campylobacter sp. FMV-PI01]|uniref:Glycosyltransferase family 9 protein n=1 Tax=Campylobacter portucalensis TaxID=2608384 RepID=A0A6L5WH59_9BACT|nr:glycosyltransferase family 9 protein [Campylobacter portucalensis]MSN96538.1 glycosyltransferase family 9 protein [Campylobacter portucalensis]